MPAFVTYLFVTLGLSAWGWRLGDGSWRVPLAIFIGLIVTRAVVGVMDHPWNMHGLFFVWVAVAAYLALIGAYVPSLFLIFSAAAYPVGHMLGGAIVTRGYVPIITDVFGILALISITGGMYVRHTDHSLDRAGYSRADFILGAVAPRLASRETTDR